MVALFRLPSVSTQMLSLSGGTTLRLLRFAHLLVACNREEQGNSTVERSETAASYPFQTSLSLLVVPLSLLLQDVLVPQRSVDLGTGKTRAAR